jgi:hypothetical protein
LYGPPEALSGWKKFLAGITKSTINMDAHSHIEQRARKGPHIRVHEFAGNAKVAQFHNALSREEYVGRLDIAVNGPSSMEVC